MVASRQSSGVETICRLPPMLLLSDGMAELDIFVVLSLFIWGLLCFVGGEEGDCRERNERRLKNKSWLKNRSLIRIFKYWAPLGTSDSETGELRSKQIDEDRDSFSARSKNYPRGCCSPGSGAWEQESPKAEAACTTGERLTHKATS